MELSIAAGKRGQIVVDTAGGPRWNGLEVSGFALRAAADGELRAEVDRLQLRDLRVQAGPASLAVAKAALEGVVLRLAMPRAGAPLALLGAQAQSLQLEGVEIEVARGSHGPGAPRSGLRLDALGGLDGELHAYVTDAAWVLDADITVPLQRGRIDFNRVVVDHVGPNSSMGISRNSIHVDAPNLGRTDLFVFTAPEIPGATYEKRGGLFSRVADRGQLDLPAFIAAWLQAPADQPLGGSARGDIDATLGRTRLTGELRLGDGALGLERQHLVLDGAAQGRNRVVLSAAVLDHKLGLRVQDLAAIASRFELFGQAGSTGPVSATLEMHATGLHRQRRDTDGPLTLTVERLNMGRLVLGSP
ncbi:hypothetical protein [Piscinibacter sp. XHJ-5]|uniref:hypothetical protein n=1 Tax=Piscinibacter sp. XHJ-5 TaxID=3037797 RepID=UPI0024533A4C|nr:hypothetical protein [Piscinibacter sp. XHJ-5]